MEEALERLRRRQVRMLLVNLAYFLALLGLGAWLFFWNGFPGMAGWILGAACLIVYLLWVRPLRQHYVAELRGEILRWGVCGFLTEVRHEPKRGVTAEQVQSVFPMERVGDAFMSREHVTGRTGTLTAELADVTFPFREGNRNAMFSGAFVQLTWPGSTFPPLSLEPRKEEQVKDLPSAQRELLEEMERFLPGGLYLKAEGDRLTLLLRGRFLGFRINPLVQLREAALRGNPFPELEQAVRLAQLLRLGRKG